MTLTKADLVQKVYQNHNFTKAQAAETVEAFLQITFKPSGILRSKINGE
jgi:hypothetical protein